MKPGFSSIGELIKKRLSEAGIKGAVVEKTASVVWDEVVGEKTASVTRVERIRDGVLYVNCRDSVWAQQLHFLKQDIIQKLNERLGGPVVKEIRLSGRGLGKGSTKNVERPQPAPAAVGLTRAEQKRIEEAAAGIENPELEDVVRRGLRAALELTARKRGPKPKG